MKLRTMLFAFLATTALALPGMAEERVATTDEAQRVTAALGKDGYHLVNSVRVDDDKFKAFAKTKEGKDVEVTLGLNDLKVLKV